MGSLKELIATYSDCIERQKEVIAINRGRLNLAVRNKNFEETRRLRQLLNTLYDEKCELEYLYGCLKEYM